MTNNNDSAPDMNFPPITVDGFISAAELSDTVSGRIEERTGIQLSVEDKASILDTLAHGASHFYEMTRAAGELAGSGDPLGALALLGTEENARDLIGDEDYNMLVGQSEGQILGITEEPEA